MFPEYVANLLRQRYLREGETPEDMFARVSRYVSLVDLFYYPDIFDVNGRSEDVVIPNISDFNPKDFLLTSHELEMFGRLYARNIHKVKVPFEEFLHFVRKNLSSDVCDSQLDFYSLMSDFDFMPSSPVLMNSGARSCQLFACFVLPVGDSVAEIFESNSLAAKIYQSGGGVGFSMSRLRSKGSPTSSGFSSSGPVPFMLVPAATIESIKQGGARKGAAMVSLRVDHPDIMEFIKCKETDTTGLFSNFNISVAITDAFWKAYQKGWDYDLIDPRTNEVVGQLSAVEVFEAITDQAHRTGDPGIFFIDKINKTNPTPHLGNIESCNPCGEVFLLPYEACNLGSINLSNFVTSDRSIDFSRLKGVVHAAVHFLDNVLDASSFPDPRIENVVLGNRKIGLGVMGFADCLARLKIPYDSDAALEVAEQIMSFISLEAKKESIELARTRGPFPNCEIQSLLNSLTWEFPDGTSLIKDLREAGIRNASLTAIAPTGTISLICQCSSGIEPIFATEYVRQDGTGTYTVRDKAFIEAKQDGWYSPEYFKCAHEVSPLAHVRIVAAFQKYTDNSISKTVNLPADAPLSLVKNVFSYAYESGCKCITVFRDKSLGVQVLNLESDKKKLPRKRAALLTGKTIKVPLTQGKMYITLNDDEYGLREVIVNIGKGGTEVSASAEALGRMLSNQLKWGVPVESIVGNLKNIHGTSTWVDGKLYKSLYDAVARVIEQYSMVAEVEDNDILCERCQSPNVQRQGTKCILCLDCGFSTCV